MSVFDARSLLGYYCYRDRVYDDALRIWSRIPKGNLEKRPEIADMLADVRHKVALATETEFETHGVLERAHDEHWRAPAEAVTGALSKLDPSATTPAGRIQLPAPAEERHPGAESPPTSAGGTGESVARPPSKGKPA
jgi:hypothetical protein